MLAFSLLRSLYPAKLDHVLDPFVREDLPKRRQQLLVAGAALEVEKLDLHQSQPSHVGRDHNHQRPSKMAALDEKRRFPWKAGLSLPRDTAWAMSDENVALIGSMYREGDPSRFFDLLDEEIEVDASGVGFLPGYPDLIHGRDAVIDYFRRWWGTWDEYVLEPTEIIDAGEDRVVVVHYERGRGRGSGTPFERRWATLYTLRADKMVRFKGFATREDALEAAGLRE